MCRLGGACLLSACARKKIKEVTDMTKKAVVRFPVSFGGFILPGFDRCFFFGRAGKPVSEEISKLEKSDGRSVGIITPSGIRRQQSLLVIFVVVGLRGKHFKERADR